MRRVIIESPFAADTPEKIAEHVAYARAAMRDCLERGEAPYASHLLLTQPGILDDKDPEQRKLGIAVGLHWGSVADATVVYADYGISPGMYKGICDAHACGRPIEYRLLRKPNARDT